MSRDPEIQRLLDEILVDAYDEDEQLWAFRQVFSDESGLPAEARLAGEPLVVLDFDYAGNPVCGLRATCRRPDGSVYEVSACDLVFPAGSSGARHIAAYRSWLGLAPHRQPKPKPKKATKVAATPGLDLSRPVELVVLAVRDTTARCQLLGGDTQLTLRSKDLWQLIPGELARVEGRKHWLRAGHNYLSGDVLDSRLEVPALGLTPLALQHEWPWDPAEEYWREEGAPLEEWERPIMERGVRPSFEMEQVVPGRDWAKDADPISDAAELYNRGDTPGARKLLMQELVSDLRCLDAHAHLGMLRFEHFPAEALRHYEVGVRIGELSVGAGNDTVLPWGQIDNRPFLRCLHGYGLCLWRLGRASEAEAVFARMLWLNPGDNQGIRFILPQVQAGMRWEAYREQEVE